MSVDVEAIAGWGVAIDTGELYAVMDLNQDKDDLSDELSNLDIEHEFFGSYYTGITSTAFLDNHEGVIEEKLHELNLKLGTSFTPGDIKFYKEVLWY